MEPFTAYIYGLYDPRTEELRYIGKTNDPRERMWNHCNPKQAGRTHRDFWIKLLRSLNLEPVMRILEVIENSNDHDWQDRERFWISHYRATGARLTNHDSGGRSGMRKCASTIEKMRQKALGRVMSREAVEKMKATKKSKFSEETRERMRQAQLGKKHSEEAREKRSASMKGHAVSEETRRKISEANKVSLRNYYASLPPKPPRAKVPPKPRAPRVVSLETREKLSAALKGRPGVKGAKRTDDQRARMSAGRKAAWDRKKALAG